jgi:two-component system response regulator AtoC
MIAATNRDMERQVAVGEFREDLYYRLNVVELRIPPLRDRREEIPGLAALFLDRFNRQYGRQKQLAPGTLVRLTEHSWSDNVRELENAIRRMVLLDDEPSRWPPRGPLRRWRSRAALRGLTHPQLR